MAQGLGTVEAGRRWARGRGEADVGRASEGFEVQQKEHMDAQA